MMTCAYIESDKKRKKKKKKKKKNTHTRTNNFTPNAKTLIYTKAENNNLHQSPKHYFTPEPKTLIFI